MPPPARRLGAAPVASWNSPWNNVILRGQVPKSRRRLTVGTDSGDAEPVVGPNKCLESYALAMPLCYPDVLSDEVHIHAWLLDACGYSWNFMDIHGFLVVFIWGACGWGQSQKFSVAVDAFKTATFQGLRSVFLAWNCRSLEHHWICCMCINWIDMFCICLVRAYHDVGSRNSYLLVCNKNMQI